VKTEEEIKNILNTLKKELKTEESINPNGERTKEGIKYPNNHWIKEVRNKVNILKWVLE